MAMTNSERQAKYDSKHRKSYAIKLHNEYDKDIIEKLAAVESMNGYIKRLIREDIARTGSVSVPKTESEEGNND